MRILFDQGVPLPLETSFLITRFKPPINLGWATLKNGQLIDAAEGQFNLVITTDKNWKYQQRIAGRTIGIVVLPSPNWPELRLRIEEIIRGINRAGPGDYVEL